MESANPPAGPTTQHLSLWDAVSIIIGIVIGAGIYETAPDILSFSSSPLLGLGVWALGGILSLIGALCYAELATTYPRSGGDYVYLSRAFGPLAGFLFGWGQLVVLMTGSIGMMAYIFADYAKVLWKPGENAPFIYASLAVVVLSLVNILGLVMGKRTQNVLTCAKILGLSAVLISGFLFGGSFSFLSESPKAFNFDMFKLAMIFTLYTYGGWSDAAFVAAEQNDRKRNVPRALVLGTLGVMVIYLLVNVAYMMALGYKGAGEAKEIAAVVLRRAIGEGGASVMCVLVMISALGAVNGMIFTGSRIYATLGTDYRLFGKLSVWHPQWRSPIWSLAAQMLITLIMVAGVGTEPGRNAMNASITGLGFEQQPLEGRSGFSTLLKCTAPVFWLFLLMTGVALFILRAKDAARERPFAVPLYPILPIIFCCTSAFMLYSAIDYAKALSLLGLIPVAVGIPVYFLAGKAKPQEMPALASVES